MLFAVPIWALLVNFDLVRPGQSNHLQHALLVSEMRSPMLGLISKTSRHHLTHHPSRSHPVVVIATVIATGLAISPSREKESGRSPVIDTERQAPPEATRPQTR